MNAQIFFLEFFLLQEKYSINFFKLIEYINRLIKHYIMKIIHQKLIHHFLLKHNNENILDEEFIQFNLIFSKKNFISLKYIISY